MSESERKALLSIVEFLEDFASPFDVSDHGWALLAEARDLLSTQPSNVFEFPRAPGPWGDGGAA